MAKKAGLAAAIAKLAAPTTVDGVGACVGATVGGEGVGEGPRDSSVTMTLVLIVALGKVKSDMPSTAWTLRVTACATETDRLLTRPATSAATGGVTNDWTLTPTLPARLRGLHSRRPAGIRVVLTWLASIFAPLPSWLLVSSTIPASTALTKSTLND